MKKIFLTVVFFSCVLLLGIRYTIADKNISIEHTAKIILDGSYLDLSDAIVSDYTIAGWASGKSAGRVFFESPDSGVFNDGFGNLSGYAWGEITGWINFDPQNGGVTIDNEGYFHGQAWSQNLGWIAFNCADQATCATDNFKVRTAWRPKNASVRGSNVFSTENISVHTGLLNIFHTDDFDHKIATHYYQILTDKGETIDLSFSNESDKPNHEDNGKNVTISGKLSADKKTLAVSKLYTTQTNQSAQDRLGNNVLSQTPISDIGVPKSRGRQYKVATILFNFSNNQGQTYSAADARHYIYDNNPNEWTSVNGYYTEATYGGIKITGKNNINNIPGNGDVFGWYALPYSDANCSSGTATNWFSDAVQIATQNGFDASQYDTIIGMFPMTTGPCGNWGGFSTYMNFGTAAQPVYKNAIINIGGYQGNLVHELGHALHLNHSNSIECYDGSGNRVSYLVPQPFTSENCVETEYGDPFDIMAGAWRHFTNFQKDKLGVLPASSKLLITNQQAGTYDLFPQETLNNSEVVAINIGYLRYTHNYNVSDNDGHFDQLGNIILSNPMTPPAYDFSGPFLEYRKVFGSWDTFQQNDPVINGVSIRHYNYLLDMTPLTATFSDAALAVGQSYTDIKSGRTITVTSVTPVKATVSISPATPLPPPPGPSCKRLGPAVFSGIQTNPLSTSGTFTTNVQVFNTDDSACSPATFSIPSDILFDPNNWSVLNESQITLSPGQQGSVTLHATIDQAVTSAGEYYFPVIVQNLDSGNIGVGGVFFEYHPATASVTPAVH